MSSLKDAFNAILSLRTRPMTLTQGYETITVNAAPANYARNLDGPSETAIEGREFVISKKDLISPITTLKRGDRLADPELGTFAIDTITEMYDIGGAIMGYRVRSK
jgi:hypothetical protein